MLDSAKAQQKGQTLFPPPFLFVRFNLLAVSVRQGNTFINVIWAVFTEILKPIALKKINEKFKNVLVNNITLVVLEIFVMFR